jgi:Domain of unknown function (DUF4440)
MKLNRIWTLLVLVALMVVPALVLNQGSAQAAGARKAEWRASKTAKSTKSTKASAPTKAPDAPDAPAPDLSGLRATEPSATPETTAAAPVQDQSQEVLDNDVAMAAAIAAQGPKDGYASALSDEGILYDANGASPVGKQAASSRFGTFPADVTLVRTPEKALAAGGSGSSWGTYTIKRGDTVLSAGRYVSVWRREAAGWKMISELAAGKTLASSSSPPAIGALPKRPVQLGRATPAPIGVPLTVPTPAATTPTSEVPPTP